MAEGSERRPKTTRPSTRHKSEVVPTGDPGHEKPLAKDTPRGPLAFLEQARDVMTVRRVFGEPIERDGVTVIPAANIRGGGGGGFGEGPDAQGRGGGGGFGVSASPAGVYIVRDGRVSWRPALDLNRTILMGQFVGIVLLLTVRSIVKAMAKRR